MNSPKANHKACQISNSGRPSLPFPIPRCYPYSPVKSGFVKCPLTPISPISQDILDEIDQELQDTQQKLFSAVHEIDMTSTSENERNWQTLPLTPAEECTAVEFLKNEATFGDHELHVECTAIEFLRSEATFGEQQPHKLAEALESVSSLQNSSGTESSEISTRSSRSSSVYSRTYEGELIEKNVKNIGEPKGTEDWENNGNEKISERTNTAPSPAIQQTLLPYEIVRKYQKPPKEQATIQEVTTKAETGVLSSNCTSKSLVHKEKTDEDSKIDAWLARGLQSNPNASCSQSEEKNPGGQSCAKHHIHPNLSSSTGSREPNTTLSSSISLTLSNSLPDHGCDSFWGWVSSNINHDDEGFHSVVPAEKELCKKIGSRFDASCQKTDLLDSNVMANDESYQEPIPKNDSGNIKRHDSYHTPPFNPLFGTFGEDVSTSAGGHRKWKSLSSSVPPRTHVHAKGNFDHSRTANLNFSPAAWPKGRGANLRSHCGNRLWNENLNKALPPMPWKTQVPESTERTEIRNVHPKISSPEKYTSYKKTGQKMREAEARDVAARRWLQECERQRQQYKTASVNKHKGSEVLGPRQVRRSDPGRTMSPSGPPTALPRIEPSIQPPKSSKESMNSLEIGLHMAGKAVRRLRTTSSDPRIKTKYHQHMHPEIQESSKIPLPPTSSDHAKVPSVVRTPRSIFSAPHKTYSEHVWKSSDTGNIVSMNDSCSIRQTPDRVFIRNSPKHNRRTCPHEPHGNQSLENSIEVTNTPGPGRRNFCSHAHSPSEPIIKWLEQNDNNSAQTSQQVRPQSRHGHDNATQPLSASATDNIIQSRFSFSTIDSYEEKEMKHDHRRTVSASAKNSSPSHHMLNGRPCTQFNLLCSGE